MGLFSKAVEKVTSIGKEYPVSALTGVELQRQRLYLIRRHYANSDHGSDGTEDCPLYYASIEGLGGSEGQTIASLKNLPKKGAPKDWRMVSLFNHAPKMVEQDVACLTNDFKWDRLEMHVDEKKDEELSRFVQDMFKEAEERSTWSLPIFLRTGASCGDVYARPKPDKTFETGVAVHLAVPEGVYPKLALWNDRVADGYRMIYKVLSEPLSTEPGAFATGSGVRECHTEVLTRQGVTVYRDETVVTHDEHGNRLSGPHPEGMELPMVHVAYQDAGDFWGIPAASADLTSDMDTCNVLAANLKSMVDGVFGTPNLFLWGISDTGDFQWGRRGVHGGPTEGQAQLLYYEGIPDLIQEIEARSSALKDKIPQFIIDDIRRKAGEDSGVALAIRLFPYDTRLADREKQYTTGLQSIARIGLKYAGKFPARGKVTLKLDWGARFPVDIMARLNAAKTQLELFGPVPELIEELARREGYPKKLVDAIVKFRKEKEETALQAEKTAAFGGGLLGATRAQEVHERKLLGAGAQGAGKEIAKP